MKKTTRQMKLGAFLPAPGHHIAAWRHPKARADGGLDFNHYRSLAETAERGKFDLIFLSDGLGIRSHYKGTDELSRWGRIVNFEPISLLSALAVVTHHIGLVATASTTYYEPFHIARKFASLDYLSNGRAGWNLVTSATDAEAQNFNLEKNPEHADRYKRANEFIDVVKGLWDSWDDDAFLYDKIAGKYFDPEKMRIFNHKGKHFSVRGPLNVARPIQGYPVIVQAGASTAGQDLAARTAEVVFTASQTLEQAQLFYRGLKNQLKKYARAENELAILPGVFVVVGSTEKEAQNKFEELQDLLDPQVGLGLLNSHVGGHIDLSQYSLDEPLPELPITNRSISRQQLIIDQARRENLTIRQLYKKIAGGRGHRTVIGTPEKIADQLEEWFFHEGADGFNIMPPHLPDGLTDFVDHVIPELQSRGVFRREYEGKTLRENLGLSRPKNQFTKE